MRKLACLLNILCSVVSPADRLITEAEYYSLSFSWTAKEEKCKSEKSVLSLAPGST